jgi:hypothetical protein
MATGYAELSIRSHDDGGVLFVNTLACKVDGASLLDPDVPMPDVAWFMTEYKALLPAAYTVTELVARKILPDDGSMGTHPVNDTGDLFAPGTANVPRELCLLLAVKTDTNTRSGRGRMFLPSPRVASFLGDTIGWNTTSDYWTAAGAFADKLLEGYDFTHDLIEYHMSFVLWSRKENLARDVVTCQRKFPYHWLRSRSTAP